MASIFGNFPKSSLDHLAWDFNKKKKKKQNGEFSPQKKSLQVCMELYNLVLERRGR